MMMYLFYWGLLVAWVVLLWPAYRLTGMARTWLLVVAAAGVAALAYETYMLLWSFADIRLDILLISIFLGGLYASAVLVLMSRKMRTSAVLLAGMLVVIGGGMTYKWVEVGRESQRLRTVIAETNRLLFKAKFSRPDVYERYFGPFGNPARGHPVGHWQISEASHYTRLIINAEGQVWLFYQCQEDAECHSRSDAEGLRQDGERPGAWQVSLKPPVGVPFEVEMTGVRSDMLSLDVRQKTYRFSKVPPPLDAAPAVQSMRYLGVYSHVECSGKHAKVRQIWLWQDSGDLLAAGTFSTLVAGRFSQFVPAIVLGKATPQPDGWRFAWQRNGSSGAARVELKDGKAILTLNQVGRDLEDAKDLPLTRTSVFSDERIELAPLTNAADWQHWFDTVLTGHFISGDVPDC